MMMLSEAELKEFKKKQKEKEKKKADDIEKKNVDAIRPVKRPASAYANPQKSAETRKGRLPHRTDKYRYGMPMKVSPGFLRKQGSLLTTAINTSPLHPTSETMDIDFFDEIPPVPATPAQLHDMEIKFDPETPVQSQAPAASKPSTIRRSADRPKKKTRKSGKSTGRPRGQKGKLRHTQKKSKHSRSKRATKRT